MINFFDIPKLEPNISNQSSVVALNFLDNSTETAKSIAIPGDISSVNAKSSKDIYLDPSDGNDVVWKAFNDLFNSPDGGTIHFGAGIFNLGGNWT